MLYNKVMSQIYIIRLLTPLGKINYLQNGIQRVDKKYMGTGLKNQKARQTNQRSTFYGFNLHTFARYVDINPYILLKRYLVIGC